MLNKNPVLAARLFKKRVDAVLLYIIKGAAEPVGVINDHWFRVEFQNRGSPHVHAIIWASLTFDDVIYSENQLCDLMGSVHQSTQLFEPLDAEHAELHGRKTLALMLDKYVSACVPSCGNSDPEKAEPFPRDGAEHPCMSLKHDNTPFGEEEIRELETLLRATQMHDPKHRPSCRKKGTVCHFHFPRMLVETTEVKFVKKAGFSASELRAVLCRNNF